MYQGAGDIIALDFMKGRSIRVAGFWFHPTPLERYRWIWYSNTGNIAKEIDLVLADGRWRILQNFVFCSAQLVNTELRVLVATLKLQLKSS